MTRWWQRLALRRRLRDAVDVVREVVRAARDDRVTGLAAEVGFFGVLSIFPAFLALSAALGALEGLVGGDVAGRVESGMLDFLQRVLTDEAEGTVSAVEQLFVEASPGVLTLGAAAALWASSRGLLAVVTALDLAYDVEETRGYLRRRVMALGLALGSVVVASLMLAMLVLGPLLGRGHDVADAFGMGEAWATAWDIGRWPVVVLVLIAWAATILHVAPSRRSPWRWDLPGAVATATLWALLSVGLRLYLAVAGAGNQVFGVLGGALVLLVWLYLLAIGLLLGGELNAVIARRRGVAEGEDG